MRHKHHIIPKYEGGSNLQENIVDLSITQHAMWHYAEWTRKGNREDYLAWKSLSRQISEEEVQVLRSKLGYKKMKELTKDKPHPATKLKGRKQSDEHIRNRSKALKGKVCCSPEAILRAAATKRKLTEEQVREIRASKEKGTVLASKYKVSRALISQVRNCKAKGYNHVV